MKEEKYWVLLAKKLNHEATHEELSELDSLLQQNSEWAAHAEQFQEIWNAKPVYSIQNSRAEDAYLLHISRLKDKVPSLQSEFQIPDTIATSPEKGSNPRLRTVLSYSAIAMFIIAAILLYLPAKDLTKAGKAQKTQNEISISPGSRSSIQLPDGSHVWINSGSKLIYGNDFSGQTREVTLEGEAYFDVKKDPAHPFIVHTSGIDIKVLGTAFNVKAYTEDPTIEATLIHGSIEVINSSKPDGPRVMMKPHEKMVFRKTGAGLASEGADLRKYEVPGILIRPLAHVTQDSAILETAWIYNKLSFEDERFEDLAIRMERWYNLKIVFQDEQVKNSKVSGSFVNETPVEALKELQYLVAFEFSVKNNEVIITKK